jgi:hypothetical protein
VKVSGDNGVYDQEPRRMAQFLPSREQAVFEAT